MRALGKSITGMELPAVEKVAEAEADNAFQILIATLLSARTQDATTAAASGRLFARARTPRSMAKLPVREIETLIYPVSFYRNKAEHVKACCDQLLTRFGGRVPDTLEALVTLPGVGRKTANMVLGDAFGTSALTVDTHFARLARRFGWTAYTDPAKIERDVAALLPRQEWTGASHRLTWHGRRVCHARTPACGACGIARLCPSFGLGPTDEETARKLVKTGPFS